MHAEASEPDFSALRVELGRLRQERGLTYEALAERTGVSRRTLIDIETGRTGGRLDTWFHIARALDVPLGDLLSHLG